MKIQKVICRDCGHEDRIETFTREEADRKNIRLGPARCPKCRSTNVIVRD